MAGWLDGKGEERFIKKYSSAFDLISNFVDLWLVFDFFICLI
jgi:hypothetical protein